MQITLLHSRSRHGFKNILNEYELEITDTMELIRHATAWISNVKRSGKSPDTQPVAAAGICPQEILCEIYHKYQQYLTAKRLIDFEDMTVYCYDLFSQRKDILWQWQEQYQYILVDEFQDIDAQQFQTLQLLADRYRNLLLLVTMTRVFTDSAEPARIICRNLKDLS